MVITLKNDKIYYSTIVIDAHCYLGDQSQPLIKIYLNSRANQRGRNNKIATDTERTWHCAFNKCDLHRIKPSAQKPTFSRKINKNKQWSRQSQSINRLSLQLCARVIGRSETRILLLYTHAYAHDALQRYGTQCIILVHDWCKSTLACSRVRIRAYERYILVLPV